MEAYSHLTDWKSLQYCSTVYIDEASPPDLQRMWAEPVYQVNGPPSPSPPQVQPHSLTVVHHCVTW